MLLAKPLMAMDCCEIPYQSNITTAWSIGTTITQTGLSALQLLFGFSSIFSDGFFHWLGHSSRVIKLREDLEAKKVEHKQIKSQEKVLIAEIMNDIHQYLSTNPDDNNEEVIAVLQNMSRKLREMAQEIQ
jgi:hypothetical protein